MLDLTTARMVHIRWIEQIKEALQRGDVPHLDHYKNCDLGQWLYQKGDQGGNRYLTFDEGKRLEEMHRQFHSTADELTRVLAEKNYGNAEILMREFNRESRDLIFLLSMLEYRILQLKQAGRIR
ncbi:MAG: CZB domain-containing protein [Gammaproteobacteria bacterium]|nr:CZB domain-containing protein [Gammaproteobacteria bacterium]